MIKKLTIALTVAGAIAVTAFTPAAAGPIPTMTAAVAQAAPDHTIDVYWRGGWRGYGPGLAFGLAAGAIAGAAIAAPYYGGGSTYYYGAPMPSYYSRPVYAAPYAYGPPVYAAPVYGGGYYEPYGYYYGYRRCFTDEGYGRRTPCDTTGQR
jgi:hypothetical protein